jgi:hypothetical protein
LRKPGASNGGIITVPPTAPALSAMASALSTRKLTFQHGPAITTLTTLTWFAALQQVGASRASVIANLQPLLVVLLGVPLFAWMSSTCAPARTSKRRGESDAIRRYEHSPFRRVGVAGAALVGSAG